MHSSIPPNVYVALKLPSDSTKLVQTVPNSNISLGKYGSFPCNQIIGRPFYATFEIADHPDDGGHVLRIVSAAELHTEALLADGEGEGEAEGDTSTPSIPFPQEDNDNRNIVDRGSTQQLTMEQIEELKQTSTHAGREIISKLLESHSALDQKTQFSRAKYMLRKRKKYLHRFTVVPMDVSMLTGWVIEQKDPGRIMELRDETLGLIGAWANVHYGGVGGTSDYSTGNVDAVAAKGRWLIVDDTGGLVVAAMAERAGILYPPEVLSGQGFNSTAKQPARPYQSAADEFPHADATFASHTTLTVIHPNMQPNLSMLKYFSHDIHEPSATHPLTTHLKTLSWLQLLHPSEDAIYDMVPPEVPEEEMVSWKPSKRTMHFKKKRRFTKVRNVVDETRAGGFDGLIVATLMDPASILKHAVPLLSGSAQVVVYSPYVEPLVQLADLYSTARRTAYITHRRKVAEGTTDEDKEEDFPVDPTLLLAPTLHTSRVRTWQVLPGRTHPLMTGRGGAEGYIFHAVRVLPAVGKVEARGVQAKKRRKTADDTESP